MDIALAREACTRCYMAWSRRATCDAARSAMASRCGRFIAQPRSVEKRCERQRARYANCFESSLWKALSGVREILRFLGALFLASACSGEQVTSGPLTISEA